ncbi:hypothetical protein OPV22_027790 [Ensete ventricosum]|uniref:DUF1421 domain-containing protein n=1 Tax=Ensete ventricosum TaxID=4639 RepID=A0AAV8Q4N0_ENSVE|nr:hypothetical protein OPV22_027790 [Ensete ventricosum]
MNATKFMDKQVMELSGTSQAAGEFFDFVNFQENRRVNGVAGGGSVKQEQQQESEILPSYDFHPIRAVGSSSFSVAAAGGGPSDSWPSLGSIDSKLASSNLKNAGVLESHELTKTSHGKEKSSHDISFVAEIDHTVKRYADNLMNALEGLSSRLSKIESRTHHMENSVDELKVAIGNNNGGTDGKLKQIENVVKEVHSGLQILQDKQQVIEAQLHVAQLKTSEGDQQLPENSKTGHSDSRQHELPPPQQLVQQPYQHPAPQAQPTMLPAAPPLPQQIPPPQIPQPPQSQIPSLPSVPQESRVPSASQQAEAPRQQFQVHIPQPQAAPPPLPPQLQHYQPSLQQPQYSQPPQSQQPVSPLPQLPPAMSQYPEEPVPYMAPPSSYAPSVRQPAPFPQPLTSPPQQFYGPMSNMYEPPASKPSSGLPPFSSGYLPPVGPSYRDSYGLPSGQSSSASKPLPIASSVSSGGSSSNYPRLPTAQILPQAAPTSPGSGGSSGTRVPIDDVVEKVATMGFSKDQVRATVRKLTENGQSVDLNVVLDKLMNDGVIQPQKGWFGR